MVCFAAPQGHDAGEGEMGSISPPLRPIPKNVSDKIDGLLESARKSGRTVVDAGYAADFVLAILPQSHLTRQEVADIVFERCTHLTRDKRHHGCQRGSLAVSDLICRLKAASLRGPTV